MIIFETTVEELHRERDSISFFNQIESNYKKLLNRRPDSSERLSWQNSLSELIQVANNSGVPGDVIVLIEYSIPISNTRIDAVFCAKDGTGKDNALIIEIKQWEKASAATQPRMVRTNVANKSLMEHPSAQVLNYRDDLANIDSTFNTISLLPLSFLHNYTNQEINGLKDVRYSDYIKEAPLFEKSSIEEFKNFLITNTKGGPSKYVYECFKNMKYNPSKSLKENAELFSGQLSMTFDNIFLYGDQTSAFRILKENVSVKSEKKNIFVVKGMAGSGKTILAMKLFLDSSINEPSVLIFPGSDFRSNIKSMFSLDEKKELFSGRVRGMPTKPNQFPKNTYSFGIVDEAHKLPRQASLSSADPLEEIISNLDNVILLFDESQIVDSRALKTMEDTMNKYKKSSTTNVIKLDLSNQFRSKGGNNFLEFIDGVFYDQSYSDFVETENFKLTIPSTEEEFIDNFEKSKTSNKRILATIGSFDWTKEIKDGKVFKDAKIAGREFNWFFSENQSTRKQYQGYSNLSSKQKEDIQLSINDDNHGEEYVAYYNTVQGGEFEHVSVFVGDELYVENDEICFDYSKLPKHARKPYRSPNGKHGEELENIEKNNKTIALNQLKVLFTRARTELNIHFKDSKLNIYFKILISK